MKRKRKVHSAIEVVTDHERENKDMYPMTKRLNIAQVYINFVLSSLTYEFSYIQKKYSVKKPGRSQLQTLDFLFFSFYYQAFFLIRAWFTLSNGEFKRFD